MTVVSGVEVEVARRRFTVEEYHRMVEAGILRANDRVELIEGEIVQMTPIGRRHSASVAELNRLQNAAVDDPEIATRIAQYELAFKMQTSVPALMEFKDEPNKVLEMYGTKGADGPRP